jgi:hypothetical protein
MQGQDERKDGVEERLENGNLGSLQEPSCMVLGGSCDDVPKMSSEPAEKSDNVHQADTEMEDATSSPAFKQQIEAVMQKLVQQTKGFGVSRLEMLHANINRQLQLNLGDDSASRLNSLQAFTADKKNF